MKQKRGMAVFFVLLLVFAVGAATGEELEACRRAADCYWSTEHLLQGMELADFEALIEEKQLASFEEKSTSEENGVLVTEYRYLPYLVLKVVGDPVQQASLITCCSEHPNVKVEIPFALMRTLGFEGRSEFSDAIVATEHNLPQVDKRACDQWLEENGMLECFGEPHERQPQLQTLLVNYMALSAMMPLGISLEDVVDVLKNCEAMGLGVVQRPIQTAARLMSYTVDKVGYCAFTVMTDEGQVCSVQLLMLAENEDGKTAHGGNLHVKTDVEW